MGTTPHRHLVSLRLNAAATMLRVTDRSVSEIAEACGYKNSAHFSAAFLAYFKRSPGSFRQSVRKPGPSANFR
jgi:AraC family transcriptional regulator